MSKTTQDLRNLFFSLQVYEIKKFPFQLFSAACNIALGASTLRRNSCKTRLPQKKYLWQNPFKVHIKLQAVYSVVYSTAEVFRHHRVRSSHRRCSVKKVSRNIFATFTGKHPCWSFFSIKFQTFSPATLLKTDSDTGVFM